MRVVAATVVEEMGFAAGASFAPFFDGRTPAQAFKAFREKNGRPAKLATQPIGSGPHTTLNYWLWEVAKADKADVQIIEMGIDATQGAILTGAVEGGSIREPALTIALKQNPKIKLIATGAEMFPNFPGVVVAVLGALADKNPKAVESLVRVVVRATNLLKEDPKRAARLSAQRSARAWSRTASCSMRSNRRRRNSPPTRAASSSRRRSCRITRSSSVRWTRRRRWMVCSRSRCMIGHWRATEAALGAERHVR